MDYKKIAKELPGAIKKVAQETITEQRMTQRQLFEGAMNPKAGRVGPAIIKQKVTAPKAPKAKETSSTLTPTKPKAPPAPKAPEVPALKGGPMSPERAAVLKKDPKLRAEYLSTIGATPTKY